MPRTSFDTALVILGLYETFAIQYGVSLNDKMIRLCHQDALTYREFKIRQVSKMYIDHVLSK